MHPQPPREAAGKRAYLSPCLIRTLSHPVVFSPYHGHFRITYCKVPRKMKAGKQIIRQALHFLSSLSFWMELPPSTGLCRTLPVISQHRLVSACQLPAQPDAKRPLWWAGDSANCVFPIHVCCAFCHTLGSKEADGNSHTKPSPPGLADRKNMWITNALLRLCFPR